MARQCSRSWILLQLSLTFLAGFICLSLYQLTFKLTEVGADATRSEAGRKRQVPSDGKAVVGQPTAATQPSPRDSKCTYWDCVDSYRCGPNSNGLIGVYVYPLVDYYDPNGTLVSPRLSREYERLLLAIVNSDYYTDDPNKACIYVPSIDLLNEQNCDDVASVANLLQSLSYWVDGKNHILFNMLTRRAAEPSTVISIPHGKALVAGGGFSHRTYRRTFDISIPVYNPAWSESEIAPADGERSQFPRKWLLVSAQAGIHDFYRQHLIRITTGRNDVLILGPCRDDQTLSDRPPLSTGVVSRTFCDEHHHRPFAYNDVLHQATFCLVLRTSWLGTAALGDALRASCIPVVAIDAYVMPFVEAIDWKRAVIFVREHDLWALQPERTVDELPNQQHRRRDLMRILDEMMRSPTALDAMRKQARFLWERYFRSMEAIGMAALRVVNDRVFPHRSWRYDQWNGSPSIADVGSRNPLGIAPLLPDRLQGFTAVVLTYDRVEQLFDVVRHLATVPSLAKVLVVWNNPGLAPPPAEEWPSVRNGSVPLVVKVTGSNRLSNRFYPYEEITTDCVLSIDDDITMLTADELQFGYEVWRENSDRIVGYPPRVHIWDNATSSWKYESQWVNDVSMVLTGAAFYHKIFSFAYTHRLPGNIRDWVDEHMNCEDIAMNYIVTNITGKAPIKVLQRMKFRSSMENNLSNDILMYMVERNECMKKFTSDFGMMPLVAVDFRADPVLYADAIMDDLKLFPDSGSI